MIDPTFLLTAMHGNQQQPRTTERCRYPSKVCHNHRTRKRNGELHRFCEDHRAKANTNQKRWARSRSRRWETKATASASPTASQTTMDPFQEEEEEERMLHEITPFATSLLQPLHSYWEPEDTMDEQLLYDFLHELTWPPIDFDHIAITKKNPMEAPKPTGLQL